MRLTVLGSSPAVPNANGACSGYLLQHDSQKILVDCGHGVVGILRSVVDLEELTAIIISHMHPDHIFDLVPLKYGFLFGTLSPIPLLLPPDGTLVLERLQSAVGLPASFFRASFQLDEYDPGDTRQIAGVTIRFAPARHFIPAYGMRFSATPDSSNDVVYTSDTGWSDSIVELVRGAGLALVESTVLGYEDEDEAGGHLTPELAGKLARVAGVKRLLLTHYAQSQAEAMRRAALDAFGGPVEMAEPRKTYSV